MNRRGFIKSTGIASLALGLNINKTFSNSNEFTKPIVIATWDVKNATKKAWEILSCDGSSIDAIEEGCKVEEANGDASFFEMITERGEAGSGITPFKFIEGTGRWKELVGLGCMGAFSMIKGFNENMKNASIIFKAKCDLPDSTLERLKNYNKSE